MLMKRQLVWATALAVAGLAGACNSAQDSAGLSPTVPSANSAQASASSSQAGLTPAEAGELSATCTAFGSGERVTNGTPPPGGAPPDATTGPPGGLGPGDRVTIGTPPPGPTPGSTLAVGGLVNGLSGSCPAVTFSMNGTIVRTDSSTSFGSGLCRR